MYVFILRASAWCCCQCAVVNHHDCLSEIFSAGYTARTWQRTVRGAGIDMLSGLCNKLYGRNAFLIDHTVFDTLHCKKCAHIRNCQFDIVHTHKYTHPHKHTPDFSILILRRSIQSLHCEMDRKNIKYYIDERFHPI